MQACIPEEVGGVGAPGVSLTKRSWAASVRSAVDGMAVEAPEIGSNALRLTMPQCRHFQSNDLMAVEREKSKIS